MTQRQRIDVFQRGLSLKQAGIIVAGVSATVALPLSMTTRWLHLRTVPSASETVWMGFTSTVNSGTGYGIVPGDIVEMPIEATTNTIYFQSASGSSTVNYVALGQS